MIDVTSITDFTFKLKEHDNMVGSVHSFKTKLKLRVAQLWRDVFTVFSRLWRRAFDASLK